MTWTASSDATGYRIHYSSDSDSGSEAIGANSATSLTLSDLNNGETYSISIMATSLYRPTSSLIKKEVTLCMRAVVCASYLCVLANYRLALLSSNSMCLCGELQRLFLKYQACRIILLTK